MKSRGLKLREVGKAAMLRAVDSNGFLVRAPSLEKAEDGTGLHLNFRGH